MIWDHPFLIEILRFFYLLWFTWTLRNEKSNLPHQKEPPYQTTHLDYLELNYITQKSGAKIVYFKNIKQETGWTIYYGAIHSVTLVAAR